MKNFLLLSILILLLSSCAGKQQTVATDAPEPLEEIQQSEETLRDDGSLWSDSTKSLFADHKAKYVGDIVTVTISESASATKEATTSTGKTSSYSAGIPNLFGWENGSWVTDHSIDLTNLIKANVANSFDGNGKTVRTDEFTASLTTQVIGKYQNGNLKIRGGKEVTVNNEVQIIYITGIIRPVDITAANTIDSKKILNARISYTGKGVISDEQSPGWLARVIDFVWPF